MHSPRDWRQWHREYDDASSSLSHRLNIVREQLDQVLARLYAHPAARSPRLISLCAGDGRDTLPVLSNRPGQPLHALLVELDEGLADAARRSAIDLRLANAAVRSADAGHTRSFEDFCPADVLLLCGVFGNISDVDVRRTIRHLPKLVSPGASVIWTRGRRADDRDPSSTGDDPSEWVRKLFQATGFEETTFVRPRDMGFRVGVSTLHVAPAPYEPAWLFTFVDAL